MTIQFASLLCLVALALDSGTAAPISDQEAAKLLLQALVQEAYAKPSAQQFERAEQQGTARAQQLPEAQQYPQVEQQSNAQQFAGLQQFKESKAQQFANLEQFVRQLLMQQFKEKSNEAELEGLFQQYDEANQAETEQFADEQQFTNTQQFADRQQSKGSTAQQFAHLEQFLQQFMQELNRAKGKEARAEQLPEAQQFRGSNNARNQHFAHLSGPIPPMG